MIEDKDLPENICIFLKGAIDTLYEKWKAIKVWREKPHTNDTMWENYFAWYGRRPVFDEHKGWLKAAQDFERYWRETVQVLRELRHAAKEAKERKAGKQDPEGVDNVADGEGLACGGDACIEPTDGDS